MSADVKTVAKDVQDRIRDLAYLMWEAAGKQQNMALQYWLDAERQVLASMQAATEIVLPAKGQRRKAAQSPAQPTAPSPAHPIEALQTEVQVSDTEDTASAEAAASGDFQTPTRKPALRKAESRRKTTN